MNVLVVSGIWPPDVGGPASHAPELADWLVGRGHRVEVVTTADAQPAPRAATRCTGSLARMPARRALRAGARLLVARRARRARTSSTRPGMFGRTRVGTLFTGTPRVLKLTGDPAYERAARYGLTGLALDDFQRAHGVQRRRAEGDARRDPLRCAPLHLPERVAGASSPRSWRLGRRRPHRGAAEPRRGAASSATARSFAAGTASTARRSSSPAGSRR